MAKLKTIPGINIQWPWSQLIASGAKTVETRTYPIPTKYIGKPLALIETPGPRGKKEAGIHKARIIGVVTFSGCFEYRTAKQWCDDFKHHRVPPDDPQYKYSKAQPKWGWEVAKVEVFDEPRTAPQRRGIVFAAACKVPVMP